MMQNTAKRRILLKAIGSLTLPLAIVGCSHSQHYATTQVVVQVSPNQTAVAEVAAPEAGSSSPTTQETAQQPSPEVSAAPAAAGHGVAQASRSVGHGVAQGARDVGSGAVELTTGSVQSIKNTPPESLTASEIDVDVAMQARDWDQVTAGYASGATVAGPIGFLYEPTRDRPLWQQGVTEIPTFMVNTALIPFAFCKTPPWKPVEWKAATVAPTYTGVPPLAAE
jgi:hypothetical protein